jgi:hypothetical protein
MIGPAFAARRGGAMCVRIEEFLPGGTFPHRIGFPTGPGGRLEQRKEDERAVARFKILW